MVFSMQGFGTLLCSLILILATHGIPNEETQWRFCLAMGGAPMAIAFYFRWKMHETEWKSSGTQDKSVSLLDESTRSNSVLQKMSTTNAEPSAWHATSMTFSKVLSSVSHTTSYQSHMYLSVTNPKHVTT